MMRAESGFAHLVSDTLMQRLFSANSVRMAVPDCWSARGRVRVSTGVALDSVFHPVANAWERFRTAYAPAKHLVHVSRPLFSADSSRAFIYVAIAQGSLSATAYVIELEAQPSGEWRQLGKALIWVS